MDRAGFAREQFEGRHMRELVGPSDYMRLEPHYRAALAGEQVITEFSYSGSGSVYQLAIVPLRDDAVGEIDGVFTVARDISAQRRVESEARQRTVQQSAVAALGVAALEGTPSDRLVDLAVDAVSTTLELELSELLELTDDREALLLRAGVGWDPGLVRSAIVPVGSAFYAGFAWGAKGPIVCSDYDTEPRFQRTTALRRHGAMATIAVAVGAKQRPYGVLAAHSRSAREFRTD